ncbi:glycosyltransferase family 4 protein [Singulisphaera acidiphila]|uniref:UDP-N-acetylmuramyl pentapeptide phosphotransferase/UDP-N-acetylglucosamine-1-phosphate transferase n=1 Tax=Singulisphaera acidiphila (strain ATCC BAA-1392 / DSM 18658 / VKM B-2454 / MOB10) TaxID=886293 RepID=L0DA32_SINAD|nr:MraY family glycosyltransferase [Singulisphaera acidiphila]AGA25693.1 UDP-N-acetylmuramyl pentapeptide phosphotransferase/UDP-N-acetylglucosamine-1-phosphate transferase [Singulisphaera acidiphila DSM 18658]
MVSRDTWIVGGAGLSLVLFAFVLSAWFCSLVRQWAPRLGLIDIPAGHKGHKMPTPLGGGLAIWLATVAVLALGASVAGFGRGALPIELAKHVGGVWERAGELGTILGLATLIMFMGLVDDRLTLGWRLRLGVQVALATVLVLSGIRVTLFWPFNHPVLGGAVSVLWVVGLTNAFNLLDNMDGLAASVGLIAALLFVGAQVAVGSLFAPAVLLVLVGALAGFLVHNRYPARLFMGDAGSNFLGFMLGALTIAGTYFRYNAKSSSFNVLAPLLVMAVPLYDTVSVIIIRLREGRSPFVGDRRHFSHRLVERGLTPPQAVRTIDLVTLAGGLGALLLHQLDAVGACVVLAQTCCLLGVVAILEVSRNPFRSE